MGLQKVSVSHLHRNHLAKRAAVTTSTGTPDSNCKTGGFITSPSNGATISTAYPLNITWDKTCLNTSSVDIYLYAPQLSPPLIHTWANAPFDSGSYNTTLNPAWWKASASAQLQLTVLASGTPIFNNPFPSGPVFNATYSGKSLPSTSPSSSNVTDVSGTISTNAHTLSPGRTAAAVLLPLIVVALVITAYLKLSRQKGKEQRQRWSQAVDKRMSTISTDWKSMSAAGAQAAIRSSIAVSTHRHSSAFTFGSIRPQSEAERDVGVSEPAPEMAQVRPRRGLGIGGEPGARVSRVSFADAPRQSGDTTRTGASSRKNVSSRAFHSAYIPPLPGQEDDEGSMSPTQTSGAVPLSQEDINTQMDVMPALSMMRTGGTTTDLLLSPPAPTYVKPETSPIPMSPESPISQPSRMKTMSPDAMLRAYAARVSYPAPAAGGMRTLYAPPSPTGTYSYATSPTSSYSPSLAQPTAPLNINANGSANANASKTVMPAGSATPMRRAPSLNKRAGANRAVSVVGEEMERYRMTAGSFGSFDEEEEEELEEGGSWAK